MIKEVETNKFRKFEVKIGTTKYYVLITYDDDDNFSEFYITKEYSAIIYFMIGFKCPYNNVYSYIDDNIIEWICNYEEMLNRIEDDE